MRQANAQDLGAIQTSTQINLDPKIYNPFSPGGARYYAVGNGKNAGVCGCLGKCRRPGEAAYGRVQAPHGHREFARAIVLKDESES